MYVQNINSLRQNKFIQYITMNFKQQKKKKQSVHNAKSKIVTR